jgi:peptidoglycan/LPS O-acetylase OafA/YrhL
MPPNDLKNLSLSAACATLFGSNLFFWLDHVGYFAVAPWKKPLLHTWSLAVEEQFYILFPTLLVAARNYMCISKRSLITALLVSSFLASIWTVFVRPSAAFFLLPTRMWEIIIGALLAVHLSRNNWICTRIPLNALAMAGISLIFLPIIFYDHSVVFPGAAALPPCLGAAALIVCGYGAKPDKLGILQALQWKPAVQIGLISYPLYLWHWPLLSLAFRLNYGQPDARGTAAALAGSLVSAWATWRFIEKPVRGRLALTSKASFFFAAMAGGAIINLASIAGWITDGLPQRIPSDRREAAARNENARQGWNYPCNSNFKKDLSASNSIELCIIGQGTGDRVLMWGDSHVEQIYSELKRLVEVAGQSESRAIIFATSPGCLPLIGLERNARDFSCERFNSAAMARALQSDIDRVVISGFWTDFFPDQDFSARTYNFVRVINHRRVPFQDEKDILSFLSASLTGEVRALRNAGKSVVIVMPYPTFVYSPPEYMWRRLFYNLQPEVLLTWQTYVSEKLKYRSVIKEVAQLTGAEIADPAGLICNPECPYQDSLVSFYMDTNHLLPRGVQRIDPILLGLIGMRRLPPADASTTSFGSAN